jgi:hypothetical protein
MPTRSQAKEAFEAMSKDFNIYAKMNEEGKRAAWAYGRDNGLIQRDRLNPTAQTEYDKYVNEWVQYAPEITPSKLPDVLKYDSNARYQVQANNAKVPLTETKPITPTPIKHIGGKQLQDIESNENLPRLKQTTPKPAIRTNPLDRSQEDYMPKKLGTADAALAGMLGGLSMGAVGKGDSDFQKLQKEHPVAYGAGYMGGMAAPFSGIAKVTAPLTAGLTKKIGSEIGKRAVSGIIPGAVVDTATGAIAGERGTDLAKRVGEGAVLGAAGDVALYGLGKAAQGILNKIGKGATKEIAQAELENMFKQGAIDGAEHQKAWQELENYYDTTSYLDEVNRSDPKYIKAEIPYRKTDLAEQKFINQDKLPEPTPVQSNTLVSKPLNKQPMTFDEFKNTVKKRRSISGNGDYALYLNGRQLTDFGSPGYERAYNDYLKRFEQLNSIKSEAATTALKEPNIIQIGSYVKVGDRDNYGRVIGYNESTNKYTITFKAKDGATATKQFDASMLELKSKKQITPQLSKSIVEPIQAPKKPELKQQNINTLPTTENLPKTKINGSSGNNLDEAAATALKEPPKKLGGRLSDVDVNIIAEKAAAWKDKPQKLAYKRETMERNFEDIITDKAEAKKMIDTYIEPIRKNEADSIRSINKMRTEVKQLGIKAFSKESELVQKYGEGLITKEELAKETANPEKIIKAADYLRSKYNELLDTANKVLEANGYRPIAKRPNYMPHQGEIETIMQQIGIENPELPTDINGLTDMFVPGKNFFANALQRKGDKTAYDAVRGFDKYIEGINKIIYQTPNIKRIRQLETTLRNKYEGTTHLSNLVSELREWGNLIAGKKSKLDRGAEEFVGRQIYKTADTIRKQLGANMVGGNVSSALTNFIPLTQTLGEVDKVSFIEAMGQTIANVLKDDGFIDKSDYLVRRFGSDRLALTNWQKAGKAANWMFQVVDGFTSQVITRAKYLENIKKGIDPETAMKEAGSYAGKVMADRSVGQIPTLFASKTLAPLNMFQIEVNNQISHLFKDLPKEFATNKAALASAYAQIALYSYVFNNLYEKATGRRPAFDVIGVAQKAYQDYNNDNLNTGEANKKLIENIANQLPFASAFTGGRIPLSNALPSVVGMATGEKDIKKELLKPVFNLALPTGGSQINKAIQGLNTYNKGGTYNNTGTQLKFPVEKDKANLIRSTLFGQYSTPESREYYDNARTPLSEKQTAEYEKLVKAGKGRNEAYEGIMKERKINSLKLKMSKIRNDKNIEWKDKVKQIEELQRQIKELNKK